MMIKIRKPNTDEIELLSVNDLRHAGIAPSSMAVTKLKRTKNFPAGVRVGKKLMYNALDIYEWLRNQMNRK